MTTNTTIPLCDLEKHLHCSFYPADNPDALVETIELSGGQTVLHESVDYEVILFVSGTMLLSRDEFPDEQISAPRLLLSHQGDTLSFCGLPSACLVVCKLVEEVRYCPQINLLELQKFAPCEMPRLQILPFKPPIANFAEGFVACLKNNLRCEAYLLPKLTELLLLLGAYYPDSETAVFFQPLVRKNSDFRRKILEIENNVITAKEMAEKCHMTEVGFRKKFKQEMGVLPKQYLLERKIRRIVKELRYGIKSNNQLCEEYGFASPSSFNNFCRNYLGAKPSDLRKIKSQNHLKKNETMVL